MLNSQELQWLTHSLPVFVQPRHDVLHGHGLCGVFVNIVNDDDDDCEKLIEVNHVYYGEGSYNRYYPFVLNTVGSFLYRSYNYFIYRRTADINHMVYRDVVLDDDDSTSVIQESTLPWRSIYSMDDAGNQTWSQGDKRDLLWYSFDHHYESEHSYDVWDHYEDTHRPVVYINTHNHLCGPVDLNESMEKVVWSSYPVFVGTRHDAERFAQHTVPVKTNAFSWLLRANMKPHESLSPNYVFL